MTSDDPLRAMYVSCSPERSMHTCSFFFTFLTLYDSINMVYDPETDCEVAA